MRIAKLAGPLAAIYVFGTALAQQSQNPDIDPLALRVLQATADTLKNAQTFSFRAVVAKERLGTNDQIITMFNEQTVTVARPDRLHVDVKSEFQNVSLYYNRGQAALFDPQKKLYTTLTVAKTLDQSMDALEKRDVFLPMSPILRSDPYRVLSDGLKSGAVIGRAEFGGKTYHHVAFTESDAEWQLWVQGGPHPTLRRTQIVYKNLPREPRVTIDYFNWNLNAKADDSLFTFTKPQDAKKIDILQSEAGK
jgi:hypothetical protein